jgi:hypothetical protein
MLSPWALLVGLLLLSDPTKLPSTILVIPFVLLFAAIYLSITEGTRLLRRGEQNRGVGAKPRLVAGLIACLPVLLLTLQSIGQLTVWDMLMVGGLFVIAYFYIIKSSIAPSGQ